MPDSKSKNILVVLAHNNFRDEEFTSIKTKLESKGAKITIASTVTQNALGSQGMKVNPDLLIDNVKPEDYDAVVFIGGTGSSQYWHDAKAHEIIRFLNDGDKVIAASSHAPVTLAVTGVLKNKNVTGHVAIYEKLLVAG